MRRVFIFIIGVFILTTGVANAQDKVARRAGVHRAEVFVASPWPARATRKGARRSGQQAVCCRSKAWIVDAKGMTAKSGATRKPDMKNYTRARC